MFKPNRKEYWIGLDAKYDLDAANMDDSEAAVEEFAAAYEATAAKMADELGITIHVIHVDYDGDATSYDVDDEAIELWQRIHDRCPAPEPSN